MEEPRLDFEDQNVDSDAFGSRLKGLQDYLLIIRERWIIALTVALPISIFFLFYQLTRPPVYQAVSTLLLEPAEKVVAIEKVVRDDFSLVLLQSHIERLRSRALFTKVAASFTDEESDKILEPYLEDLDPDKPLPTLANVLSGSYEISMPMDSSPTIYIQARSRSAEGAAIIANKVQSEYLEFLLDRVDVSNDSALAFLREQAQERRNLVSDADAKIQAYRQKYNLVSLEDSQNIVVERLKSLNEARTQARIKRLELESVLKQVNEFKTQGKDFFEIEHIANYGPLPSLKQQMLELESQRDVYSEKYLERHPAMIENARSMEVTRSQIQKMIALSIADLKSRYDQAAAREDRMGKELQEAEQDSLKLDDIAVEFNVLKRQLEVERQIYSQILDRLNEAEIASQLAGHNLRVVDFALPPGGPVSPNPRSIYTRTVMIFLGLFFGVPFLIEFLDNKIKGVWDVEFYIKQNLLAEIPFVSGLGDEKSSIVSHLNDSDDLVEALRSLYEQMNIHSEGFPKVLLVTSSIPSEGKSFISSSIGSSFAKHGRKTLIIDFDFRKPTISKLFELKTEDGLLPFLEHYRDKGNLSEEVSSPQLPIQLVQPNLSILAAGGRSKEAAELMDTPIFDDLLKNLKKQFDVIIFDTPPIGIFPDGVALAQKSDELVYVARYKKVNRKLIKDLLDRMKKTGIHCLGVVINDIPDNKISHYYYYGYGQKSYRNYYGDEKEVSGQVKEKSLKNKALSKFFKRK